METLTNEKKIELLTAAVHKLEGEELCKDILALDVNGEGISPLSDKAVQHCAVGVLQFVVRDEDYIDIEVVSWRPYYNRFYCEQLLQEVGQDVPIQYHRSYEEITAPVVSFNNDRNTEKSDVISLFQKTIARISETIKEETNA